MIIEHIPERKRVLLTCKDKRHVRDKLQSLLRDGVHQGLHHSTLLNHGMV